VANDLRSGSLRLSDLRDSQVGDASLENLLRTLTCKMQAATRLAVFAYQAADEGHPKLAAAFGELAETERRSFHALLACLPRYLEEMPASTMTAKGGYR
jgi:hypothetical protein